jgi:hypothetical protein
LIKNFDNGYSNIVKICDMCKKEIVTSYSSIIRSRKSRQCELDYCKSCSEKVSRKTPSEETIKKAIDLYYNKYLTLREIEKLLNVNRIIIVRCFNEKGLISRDKSEKRIKDPSEQKIIVDKYLNGDSLSWLSKLHKCSISVIRRILEKYNIEFRDPYKSCHYKFIDKNGRKMYLRSSWEVRVALWLDLKDKKWDYEKEKFKLNDKKIYIPDFWIYDTNMNLEKIIDVKGFRSINFHGMSKITNFIKEYPNIKLEIWDKRKLEELEIFKIEIPQNISSGLKPLTISPEEGQIIDSYEKNISIREISKMIHRARSNISTFLKFNNYQV